jgi:pyruvate,water dikinase
VVKALGALKAMDGNTMLVCPSVSRELVPFFPKPMVLVTDTGGVQAPAATVAREYGIPTIVGTSKATELINDGDFVRVDGRRGEVAIISHA